ncbi:hypothetical protein RB195_010991 [Necator americanus]|uniref:Uncharacterized protein n=1 Tax=Necator americanus TaxID=51031 RepID=A0ABR1D1D3_NECAM
MSSTSAATFKIRPIISCVGGPTDQISWFLNKIQICTPDFSESALNMFKSAIEVGTGNEERHESRRLALKTTYAYGDTVRSHYRRTRAVNSNVPRENKIDLCLPFISDSISTAVVVVAALFKRNYKTM